VFLVGIPTMFAASGFAFLELAKDGKLGGENWASVAVAFAAAAITGFAVVRWLMGYIKAHRFTAFAIYRIILGLLLLALMPAGA
jgi:undecaprenyl-diphosphatase